MTAESDVRAGLYDPYVSTAQAGPASADIAAQFKSGVVYLDWLIGRFVPPNTECAILDLGAGHGALVHRLHQKGYARTIGVELSAEQVAHARSLGVDGVIHGDLFAFGADCSDQSQDVIFMRGSLVCSSSRCWPPCA